MNVHRPCMVTVLRAGALQALLASGLLACSATQGSPGRDEGAAPSMSDGNLQAGASSAGSGAAGASQGTGTAGTTEDAGTAGSAGHGGSAGTTGAPGVSDAQLAALAATCGFIDTSMLHSQCSKTAMVGNAACSHDELDDSCSYFQFALDDPEAARAPAFVCQARCVALEGDPFWTGWCTACARVTCATPGPGEVHELDTSDCKTRPLTPCVEGFETRQLNLDATLTALLPQVSGAHSELHNTTLEIELRDGCVTRFYAPSGENPLTRVSAVLGPAVADKRFACADPVSCARIQGPDTLATP